MEKRPEFNWPGLKSFPELQNISIEETISVRSRRLKIQRRSEIFPLLLLNRSIQNLKLTQFFSSFLNCLFKTECGSLGGQNRLVKLNVPHLPPLSILERYTLEKKLLLEKGWNKTFHKTNF